MIEKLKKKYNELDPYKQGLLHGIAITGLTFTLVRSMVG